MPFLTIPSTGRTLFYTDTHPQKQHESSTMVPPCTTFLIHGLGSSSNFYASVIPALKTVTRCIALDTAGSGLSPVPAQDTLSTAENLAQDAIMLLDSLTIGSGVEENQFRERVVVIGHSMGGIVANIIAGRFPDRVRGVVLLGPVNAGGHALKEVFQNRIAVVEKEGMEPLASTIPHLATSPSASILSQAFIRTLILATPSDGYIYSCKAILSAPPASSLRLSELNVPVLILVGRDDKTAPVSMAEDIIQAYGSGSGPDAKREIKVLDGVGHWYCVEDPTLVSSEIVGFLKRL